jgi:virginiamycin B lyase
VTFHRAMSVVMLLALTSVTTPVVAEETTREARIEATIPQPGNVMGLGFDSLWMMNLATNNLIRIDTDDNSVTEIAIPHAVGPFYYAGMAVGDGGVWLPDLERSMIYKIDPKSDQVIKEIPADLVGGRGTGGKYAIAAGEGAVWAITSHNELKRYSAKDGTEAATISLPSQSLGVIVAFGSVWITGTANDELYRIDPRTNQIAATIALGARPLALAAGDEGAVWIFNEGDGTVQRIDGKSGDLVATIATGVVGKGAIDVGGGFVWASTHAAPIIQIDPRTNSVRGKFQLEMSEYSTIRFGGGSLWVSGRTVRRIKPPE